MELDVDDDAIEIDDDSVVSEAIDDTATVEYTRDDDPEIQDLLPTTEVERETQLPPPEPRRAPAAKTAISKTQEDESGNGLKWALGLVVVLVALLAVYSAMKSSSSTKEVVKIGGESAKKVAVDQDSGMSSDPKQLLAEAVDAGQDAAASTEVIAALAAAPEPLLASLETARKAAVDRGEELEKEAQEGEESSGDDASDPTSTQARTGASASPSGARAAKKKEESEEAPPAGTKCPSGMVLVKRKAGNHCVDVFEYPARGVKPKTKVNWFDAKKLCEQKQKRLCTLAEWRASCGSRYPYGSSFDAERCNTADEDGFERTLAAAGSFKQCRSRSGAYDMSGNVHEWVEERRIAGGSFESDEEVASCRYSSAKAPGSSAGDIGFRCCATPQ